MLIVASQTLRLDCAVFREIRQSQMSEMCAEMFPIHVHLVVS